MPCSHRTCVEPVKNQPATASFLRHHALHPHFARPSSNAGSNTTGIAFQAKNTACNNTAMLNDCAWTLFLLNTGRRYLRPGANDRNTDRCFLLVFVAFLFLD